MTPHSSTSTHSPLAANGALTTLRTWLQGDLIAPEDPAYATERMIWNGMIDRRPAAIVRCLGTADVVVALKFARTDGPCPSAAAGTTSPVCP